MSFKRALRTQPLRRSRQPRSLPERPTRRHPVPKGPDQATVERVIKRATREGRGPCCEVCGESIYGDRAFNWSVHHRRRRDGRPDMNSVQNLMFVCGADNVSGCHGWIHQRRSESQPRGWWLSRIAARGGAVADPLLAPVTIDRGSRVVYFTAAGTYADNPPDRSAW